MQRINIQIQMLQSEDIPLILLVRPYLAVPEHHFFCPVGWGEFFFWWWTSHRSSPRLRTERHRKPTPQQVIKTPHTLNPSPVSINAHTIHTTFLHFPIRYQDLSTRYQKHPKTRMFIHHPESPPLGNDSTQERRSFALNPRRYPFHLAAAGLCSNPWLATRGPKAMGEPVEIKHWKSWNIVLFWKN